ncbi:hypothetical protein D1007_56531 [Hordeum vulgare]|nr:hypothetical protein D1007_56531 [Hordeum vulgare]
MNPISDISNLASGLTQRTEMLDPHDIRMTLLWGAGIVIAYSWFSKRSCKTGYIWHDLITDDPMHPASNAEYVLKGSEMLRILTTQAYLRCATPPLAHPCPPLPPAAGSGTRRRCP